MIVTNTPRGPDDPRHDPNWRMKDHGPVKGEYKSIETWLKEGTPLDAALKPLAMAASAVNHQGRLPVDSNERKDVPIYSGVIRYFPDALAEVARLSKIGNDKHNPGQPLHWARSKSTDELDSLSRHLAECGTIDTDGIYHDVKVAWRALSNLQKLMEKIHNLPISPGSKE